MATFNGILLAPDTTSLNAPNPKRRQVTAVPGQNGRFMLDMGTDGGTIVVEGTIHGVSASDLASQEQTWYSYQAYGLMYAYVDNQSNSLQCILEKYEPLEKIQGGGDGSTCRKARWTFIYNT